MKDVIYFVEDTENNSTVKCESVDEVKSVFEEFYDESPISYEEMPFTIYQFSMQVEGKIVTPTELGIIEEVE